MAGPTLMVRLPEGDYMPFFQASPGKGKARVAATPVRMSAFRLDAFPVTNAQFLDFVRQHPEWRRSRIKPLFADQHYLAKWRSDLEAARCGSGIRTCDKRVMVRSRGLLRSAGPAAADNRTVGVRPRRSRTQTNEIAQRSLDWFSAPNPEHLSAVGRGEPNGFGIYDLVGLVWEWTLDNNSFMTGTEQRNTSSKDDAAFLR